MDTTRNPGETDEQFIARIRKETLERLAKGPQPITYRNADRTVYRAPDGRVFNFKKRNRNR